MFFLSKLKKISFSEKMYLHYLIHEFESKYSVNRVHNKQIEAILDFE